MVSLKVTTAGMIIIFAIDPHRPERTFCLWMSGCVCDQLPERDLFELVQNVGPDNQFIPVAPHFPNHIEIIYFQKVNQISSND
jgi:hypothetical protein